MNTNTQTFRDCDIELLKAARELPIVYAPGIRYLLQWMKEEKDRSPFYITDAEINSIMEQHPDSIPFFTAVLEAREARRI